MSEAIKQYLEAVEKATDFRHGDSLERFLIAEADMHRVARAAMDAAHEVRELVRELKRLDLKFRSGNSVPVERATITADEWNRIRELVR